MDGRMKSWSLVILLLSASSAVADELSTWQASRERMPLAEKRDDLLRAQQLIDECDRLVEAMKEYDQHRYANQSDGWQEFVQRYRPSIHQLIQNGRQLKESDVGAAGQLPEVTNVLLIALGYEEGTNAFDTMLRIYEEDRDKAALDVRQRARRLPRKWSNRSGSQTVIAELIAHDSNKVVLRRVDDGRRVTVIIEKLSDIDRSFLTRLADSRSLRDSQMLKEIGIERRTVSE